MKKILIVVNSKYVVTNFRIELLESLISLGHDVKIVSPQGIDLDGQTTGNEVLGIRLSRGGVNPFLDLKTIWDLFRIFRKEKPDYILNFTIKPVLYSSIVGGLFTKAKIFSNITGLGYVFIETSFKARFLRVIVKFLCRYALSFNKKVFFQNPDDRDMFRDLGLVKASQVVLLNGSGINLSKFSFRENYKERELGSFLFVGRLLKDKGINELIKAMSIVKESYPEAQCYVVGETDNNPNSLTLDEVRKWESKGIVQFLGRFEDVRVFLKSKSVFVLPSYREGTPRSVLEAMSMGMPIITTDAPGCKETVENGKNGFLVPVKNEKILAEKMIYFLQHPQEVANMGRASRELAEKKYDVIKVNQCVLEAMEMG